MSDQKKLEKYYCVVLNGCVSSGMTHQLWGIVNALIIGHYVGRNVVFPGYHVSYNSKKTIHIHELFDIDHINKFISDSTNLGGFKSQILPYPTEGEHRQWVESKYPDALMHDEWSKLKPQHRLMTMIARFCEEEHNIQNVKMISFFINPVNYYFGAIPCLYYDSLQMILNMRPCKKIMDIVDDIKSKIGENYYAVHLRLEDDWIKYITTFKKENDRYGQTFEEASTDMFNRYVKCLEEILSEMKEQDNIKIYIATSLEKYPNKNNNFIDDLCKKFKGVCMRPSVIPWQTVFPTTIDEIDNGIHHLQFGGYENNNLNDSDKNCRDLEAIIDFEMCKGASGFVGLIKSNFSFAIHEIFSQVLFRPSKCIN
jgi:hypothetical protein